jgi:hypothetical protein
MVDGKGTSVITSNCLARSNLVHSRQRSLCGDCVSNDVFDSCMLEVRRLH